jgi:predicted acylesterase/phospholipase RssA
MFTLEINEFEVVTLSYITHPDLPLLNALHMTSALPIIISPVCIENKCYVDGGMACNYPLNYCIESGKQPHEILGFKNKYSDTKNNITGESNLLEFLMSFIYKAIFSLSTDKCQPIIANEVICDVSNLNFDFLKDAVSNIEVRKELFESGVSCAKTFLSKSTSNENSNNSNEEKDSSEKNKEIDIDKELENSIQELN